jgi:hypothetical protein
MTHPLLRHASTSLRSVQRALWTRLNLWIALGLLLANGLAWLNSTPVVLPPEVEPRLDPQIAVIREKMWSGQASGESFSIVITEQMAAEGIAWFLMRHPEVPFSHPQVEIDAQGVTGRGLAHVFGLRTPVYGRATITLRQGVPVITIQQINIAGANVPDFVLSAIQAEVEAQLNASQRLPIILSRLELSDGMLSAEGIYR